MTPHTTARVIEFGDAGNIYDSPEAALRREFTAAVDRHGRGSRTIFFASPKNLYVSDVQANIYLRLMGAPAYSSAFHDEARAVITSASKKIISSLSSPVSFFDLGPGFPDKSFSIIDSAVEAGLRLAYFPVDVNRRFLSIATSSMAERYPHVTTRPLHCLFEDLPGYFRDARELADIGTRLFLLGLTFMNFEPDPVLSMLRSITRHDDVSVIAANLATTAPARDIVSPYRNEAAAQFNFSSLAFLGIERGAMSYFARFRSNRIEMGFSCRSNVQVKLDGDETELLRAGTEIITAVSYRYTLKSLRAVLAKFFSGCEVMGDNRTVIALLRP